MKLFLASRIHNPNTIEKLEQCVGGFKGKKIVYIPTASNGENKWGYWKVKTDGAWKLVNTFGADVKPILLEDYGNDTVIEELEGKDIIWFAGGMPGYLMYWIRRCKINLHIKRILQTGTLFLGASAGAMVAGKTLQAATFGFVDGERGADNIKPMELVDFDIFPHYDEKFLSKIKKNYNGGKLYLLKDGEEIIVEDGKITVIGEERIIAK
jgi:peptidase E